MKNTSVTPRATFDAISSPNQTPKIGARITRGMEFSALMYGSSSDEAVALSASHSPMASPSTVPMTKARNSTTCQRLNPLLLLLGIAFQHFVLHCAPDEGMELDEARREADLGDVARP